LIETKPRAFDLADVAAIEVRRTTNVNYEVTGAHSRVSRRSVSSLGERAAMLAEAAAGGATVRRLGARSVYYVRLVLGDGSKTRELSLLDADLPRLWAGQLVPMMGIDETLAYPHGPREMVHTRLDVRRDGAVRGERFTYKLPMELMRVAVRRAQLAPLPASGQIVTVGFDVKARHRAFWTPAAQIEWTPKALAAFELHRGARWGERGTLADCVADRLAHTASYSRNARDAYTLRVAKDSWSESSFYWSITRDRDGKQMYNGGIIWHAGDGPGGGEYGVHT
jgi:hypothetical protein